MRQATTDGRRIVQAPCPPDGYHSTTGVVSVTLSDDEEVEWIYSPDGKSVIGYTIKKKNNTSLGAIDVLPNGKQAVAPTFYSYKDAKPPYDIILGFTKAKEKSEIAIGVHSLLKSLNRSTISYDTAKRVIQRRMKRAILELKPSATVHDMESALKNSDNWYYKAFGKDDRHQNRERTK